MDKSNNKKRILALINILRKKTSGDKTLKLQEIIDLLKLEGIEINNRKTLYDDFKILNEYGINVEYQDGYYLIDAPFNLSEIKIIQDSINSLKNLDTKLLNNLNNKLYSFISDDEVKLLESLKYLNKHKDTKLLQHMEDIIEAIKNKTSVLVSTNNLTDMEVFPCFIHRENDYYYFYYHYPNSPKLYHYRFDNIKNIKLTSNYDSINIQRKEILRKIDESSKSYSLGNSETLKISLLKEDERIISQFLDDFPGSFKTKEGFALKADINNVFFSKLVAYKDNIKIENKDIAKSYKKYLEEIVSIYKK